MPNLSAVARQEYHAELANCLPLPLVDQPEHRQRRLTTAVEAFEALCPGDSYEARLAVQVVLSGAHAAEALQEAGVYREDFMKRTRCRAQAASLMREGRAAKRALAQEQKVRLATEAAANTRQGADAARCYELRLATEAAANITQTAPEASPAPSPQAAPQASLQAQAGSAPPPSPEAIAKAEDFMQQDGVAAAQIRHDGGITRQNKAFLRHMTLPTDPAMIDALVRGTSDLLTLLDEVGGETLDEAA